MNPDTNRFEQLVDLSEDKNCLKKIQSALENHGKLYRPNGEPVPKTWSVFRVGEKVVIKDYTFEVKYIGETAILFEPVSPIIENKED